MNEVAYQALRREGFTGVQARALAEAGYTVVLRWPVIDIVAVAS